MVYVLTYDGGSETTERHLPFWQAHNQEIVFVSPAEAPYNGSGTHIHVGPKGHGEGAAMQFRCILRHIAADPADEPSFIYEYDSFCLKLPKEPFCRGLWGNVRWQPNPVFLAMRYAMAPWVLDQRSALKILQASDEWYNLGNHWPHDRLISGWAMLANIPIFSFADQGFTDNVITPAEHRAAIANMHPMPVWFHGVKSAETLAMIKQLWDRKTD
jgi:hypothetical protein